MDQKVSILWVLTTQWRAHACGFAGDPNAQTPCLDALASQSLNYAQAVTPHPFGPFARAAMLTGMPSPENGVRDYFDPLPVYAPASASGRRTRPTAESGVRTEERFAKASRLPPRELGRTIAHELNDRGYETAFFGKWHLGKRDPHAALVGPAHAKTIVPSEGRGGFGHWEGFESGFLLNDPWLHGSAIEVPRQFEGYQSDVVCERAAAWCRSAGGAPGADSARRNPWFCIVSLEPPHPPYDAPAAGVPAQDARSLVLRGNVPLGGAAEAKARSELAGYYAHIEATDRAIGRLVAAVDATEARHGRPRPIVVFTSVHGDMHGAHGLFRKGWPHEESVRVPLLVRNAGKPGSSSGVASFELVSLLDLPRWTVGWASGIEPGIQTQKLETDAFGQWISMPSVVTLPHQCDRVWRGVRTRTRKLVLNADGSPWFLFDLEADPLEMHNLAGEPAHRAEIERLREHV